MTSPAVAAVRAEQRRRAAWPYRELDVARLRDAGWRPVPVRDVIVKVHQRCNLAGDLRDALGARCAVEVGVQTNGVLLTERVLAQLREHRVTVGVSVDGTRANHDQHRVTHAGRGTFDRVAAALDRLRQPENKDCYGGLLCTVTRRPSPPVRRRSPLQWTTSGPGRRHRRCVPCPPSAPPRTCRRPTATCGSRSA
ncbi:hypothetical protein WEI85_37600 [Actinomycetes bacterium KLBMP 9797]